VWQVIAAVAIREGTKQVLKYVAVAVAGMGVGGGAVGLVKSREVAKLERKLRERATATDRERYTALQSELADLQERQRASSQETESLRRWIDALIVGLRAKQ